MCEVFGTTGYIATTYTYSPYGEVTANGSVEQPIQWSSELLDKETELVYYNYRYYAPLKGKWNQRDTDSSIIKNLYEYCSCSPIAFFDVSGKSIYGKTTQYSVVNETDPNFIGRTIMERMSMVQDNGKGKYPGTRCINYITLEIRIHIKINSYNFDKIHLFGLWKNMMGALPNKILDFSDTVVSIYPQKLCLTLWQ